MKLSASMLSSFTAGPEPRLRSLTIKSVGGGPAGTSTFGGLGTPAIGSLASVPGGLFLGAASSLAVVEPWSSVAAVEFSVAAVESPPPQAATASAKQSSAIAAKIFMQKDSRRLQRSGLL